MKQEKSSIKLSKKQKEVIAEMRLGKQLYYWFGIWSQYFLLNGKRQNKATMDSLKRNGLIELDRIEMGGGTKHYYKLTELGKTCEI